MDLEIIKKKLRERIEVQGVTLTQIANESGVSVATLSRFNTNKGILGYYSAKKLEAWLSGATYKKSKSEVLASKKIKVGKFTFLVTIKLIK